jgi:hypothetical protein
MKWTAKIALGLLVLTSLAGCSFDLFHDTSWLTACEIDPSTPGCPAATDVDASSDADVDGDVGAGADSAADVVSAPDADSGD